MDTYYQVEIKEIGVIQPVDPQQGIEASHTPKGLIFLQRLNGDTDLRSIIAALNNLALKRERRKRKKPAED